jgi:hypothetical protein
MPRIFIRTFTYLSAACTALLISRFVYGRFKYFVRAARELAADEEERAIFRSPAWPKGDAM